MDQQIEDLVRRMGGANVIRVDSPADILRELGGHIKPHDSKTSDTTATLQGHHHPTTAKRDEPLVPILLGELERDHHHQGKIIYLRVLASDFEAGTTYNVEDQDGTQGELWSLIIRPLGGEVLRNHTVIAVSEPYYGLDPEGHLAICLHHPTDCRYVSRLDPASAAFPMSAPLGDDVDLLKLGNFAFATGRMLEAISLYGCEMDKCLKSSSKMVDVGMKRAFCYSRLGAHTSALQDVEAVLDVQPENAQALKLAFSAVLESDLSGSALRFANKLVQIDGGSATSHSFVANARRRVFQSTGVYDFAALIRATGNSIVCKEIGSFTGSIEVRSSEVAGRGLFATREVSAGELLLCEKAVAIGSREEAAQFGHGVNDILLGEKTSGRVLSLLQQVANKALLHPELLEMVLQLHGGDEYPSALTAHDEASAPPTFDSYRILSILKHNMHTILPGSTSLHHDTADLANKTQPDPSLAPSKDQAVGLWLKGSMFNHSCLPICTWSWIGDMFIARANRDIKADEELTITYLPNSYDYEKRSRILKSHNGFECACPLCRADASISEKSKISRMQMQELLRGRLTRCGKTLPDLELAVVETLQSYEYPAYDELPHIQLADVFVQMANVYLGDIDHWELASAETKTKAKACFRAALQCGLGIRLITANEKEGGYAELIFGRHCQPKSVGVLAILGLSELAYNEGRVQSCRALKACAREIYKIFYGEDATFGEKHGSYKCREVPARQGIKPVNWEERLRKAREEKSLVPALLRPS